MEEWRAIDTLVDGLIFNGMLLYTVRICGGFSYIYICEQLYKQQLRGAGKLENLIADLF